MTDVAGLLVGHHQRTGRGWQTGTTVVLAPDGVTAAVDVRGGGPGTRETEALDPRNLVDRIHAVCLSGGSAYGLSAADGVMRVLEARGLGVQVGPAQGEVVPVVPSAVIFDLGRGGRFTNRPDADFGERATRAARPSTRRGSVGAGTGAKAGGLQGGIGMASVTLDIDGVAVTVAALVVANCAGLVIDPATGLPFLPSTALKRPSRSDRRAYLDRRAEVEAPSLNTTIGVVATDADLSRPEAGRLAMSAHDGIARAVRPAHTLVDGDTVFALATGAHALSRDGHHLGQRGASRVNDLVRIHAAAADVFATACLDAVLTATTVGEAPAYQDLCPSAFRQADTETFDGAE